MVEFEVSDDISADEARQLIEAEPPLSNTDSNPFQKQLQKKGVKLMADREILLSLEKNQVIIADLPKPLKIRFYYSIIPEISITICNSCFRMFHADDFEMAYLRSGGCPFCRNVPQRNSNAISVDDDELDDL
ncbi:unnamed protein product [Anisakis simplex]|uniref:Uncharacterized protein n=1 Tax=Anisakis simplex TaxID=6269 RepID=A0A3P6PGJ0_ANISI|nr:unnamed protein product [Anisakis simplex]